MGSIEENQRILAGVKAKDLQIVCAIFDDRIRLTLDAWRRAVDAAAPGRAAGPPR